MVKTRLSIFANCINTYLKSHGDKEVLFVSTDSASEVHPFNLYVTDICNDPAETSLCRKHDIVHIMKYDDTEDIDLDSSLEDTNAFNSGYEEGYEAGMAAGIREQKRKDMLEEKTNRIMIKCLFTASLICSVISLITKAKKK